MTAAIRSAPETGRSILHDRIIERGGYRESAVDVDAAIADFRKTLEQDPEHIRAGQALERLGVDGGG